MNSRNFVTRREYDAWISECASLALAVGYPVQKSMINDNTGLILGDDQYAAFEEGMWDRRPFELFAIFEALNEPTVSGLPEEARAFAEYGGLCDKLMIVHPGKFCAPHLHWRKTEYYEVVFGEMDLFYSADIIENHVAGVSREGLLDATPMPKGDAWPDDVELPAGREGTYELLTEYRRLRPGDPKFVMHRKHLHAFRCPQDATTPVVIRENSTYSHEPTDSAQLKGLSEWAAIHDNHFLHEPANSGRLANHIVDSVPARVTKP